MMLSAKLVEPPPEPLDSFDELELLELELLLAVVVLLLVVVAGAGAETTALTTLCCVVGLDVVGVDVASTVVVVVAAVVVVEVGVTGSATVVVVTGSSKVAPAVYVSVVVTFGTVGVGVVVLDPNEQDLYTPPIGSTPHAPFVQLYVPGWNSWYTYVPLAP